MGSPDISRLSLDPRKRYTNVHMQQGRILLDDDWNAQAHILEEDQRQNRLLTVGSSGSPDDGFRITNLQSVTIGSQPFYDFTILEGTFYLSGHRLEQRDDAATQHPPMTFLTQTDNLQLIDTTKPFSPPTGPRKDLVVLLAYPQSVTAVEDSELLEVALGGPDTTTRQRMLQQILVFENLSADTCTTAWEEVKKQLRNQTEGWGKFTPEDGWTTEARLSVSFAHNSGANPTPCSPAVQQGYLGPDNQAIRVQMTASNKLTWGFDNASSLYRVQVVEGDRKKLRLLNPPRDQAHWPLSKQVVELLPCTAQLPNHEKLAAMTGHFTRVNASYNPDNQEITIDTDLPSSFDRWQQRPDSGAITPEIPYYFMRVWDRGTDQTSPPEITVTYPPSNHSSNEITLGNTGVKIQLTQIAGDPDYTLRSGDFWVVGVRPETPQQVNPWLLSNGSKKPDGPARFMAPLAMLSWQDADPSNTIITDCRRRFRPLTEQHQCCSYSVGDGMKSFGDYNSLEDALSHLPPSGGKICLLPGLHKASVTIGQKADITITGCGPDSLLIPALNTPASTPSPPSLGQIITQRSTPIFTIADSDNITIKDLSLVSLEGSVLDISNSKNIHLHNNHILSMEGNLLLNCEHLQLENNIIRTLDKANTPPLSTPALDVLAKSVTIQDNQICVVPKEKVPTSQLLGQLPDPLGALDTDLSALYAAPKALARYAAFYWHFTFDNFAFTARPTPAYQTLGGIQIRGGSEYLNISNNKIYCGLGNGLTFGNTPTPTTAPATDPFTSSPFIAQHKTIQGIIKQGNIAAQHLPIFLRDTVTNDTFSATTDSFGRWLVNVQVTTNPYKLTIADQTYHVQSVTTLNGTGQISKFEVQVSAASGFQAMGTLAFISHVTLEKNTIGYMGQSGIGLPYANATTVSAGLSGFAIPSAAPQLNSTLGSFGTCNGFVRHLSIQENQIFQCLQNAFNTTPEDSETARGVGGISLGLCDELTIQGNRIESNGRDFLGPACGIFVMFGHNITIDNNAILYNGLAQESPSQKGQTGGVMVYLCSPSQHATNPSTQTLPTGRSEKYALQIQNNKIQQSVGNPVIAQALGPISLKNNYLGSSRAHSSATTLTPAQDQRIQVAPGKSAFGSLHPLNELAGTVFLFTLGANSISQPSQLGTTGSNGDGQTAPLFSGLEYKESLSLSVLPLGDIFSHGNQFSLDSTGMSKSTSVLLFAANHIHHQDNTSDIRSCADLIANNILYGLTVQANNNRLQEPMFSFAPTPYLPNAAARLSLLSAGLLMNNTSHNMGNHCSLVYGGFGGFRMVNQYNLALFEANTNCSTGIAEVYTAVQEVSDTFYVAM